MRRPASCLFLGLIAALASTTACLVGALAEDSVEPTGCPVEQLEITEERQPLQGPSSWTAICTAPGAEPREWMCARADIGRRVICTDVPR